MYTQSLILVFRCYPCVCTIHQCCSAYLPFQLHGHLSTPQHFFLFVHSALALYHSSVSYHPLLQHCPQLSECIPCSTPPLVLSLFVDLYFPLFKPTFHQLCVGYSRRSRIFLKRGPLLCEIWGRRQLGPTGW